MPMIEDPTEPAPVPIQSDAEPAAQPGVPAVSPAQERFRSCRWRAQESGDYCTHRDVLPLAGKEGFKPDAWCPECGFYKLRRTPKKRDYNAY